MDFKEKLYVATFSQNYKQAISRYGIGMEINHTCISESLDGESNGHLSLIKEITDDINQTGANRLIIHGPFTEIYPAAIDHKARELGMIRLNQAYCVALKLGVNKMVVHSGWLPFIYFKTWQAEKGAAFWRSFMEDKPQDFTICVENVLEDEPFMLLDLMKQTDDPRIRLCLDVGHANAMTEKSITVEKWIEILGPYISHFHLHNNDGTGDSHSAFDEGTMNMNSIFKTIDNFCPKSTTLTIEARDCLACLNWLGENGYI